MYDYRITFTDGKTMDLCQHTDIFSAIIEAQENMKLYEIDFWEIQKIELLND